MEEIVCGVLGWTENDMHVRSSREFYMCYRGYLRQKEIIRTQCYYSMVGMAKKGFSIDKVWLPGDPKKKEKEGTAEILSKEEYLALCLKGGIEPSKELINRLYGEK